MGGRDRAVEVEGGRRRGRRLVQLAVLAGVVGGIVGLAPQPAEAEARFTFERPYDECGGPVLKKAATSRTDPAQYWDCTFVDEFTTAGVDSTKWVAQQTKTSKYTLGGECQVDRPQNIEVVPTASRMTFRDSGFLRLTARDEGQLVDCSHPTKEIKSDHTGATLMTFQRFTQAYGRFEVRAKMPAVNVPGAQFSFWLYRADGQPAGEIDPMEWYSQYSDRGVPMLHGATGAYTAQHCVFDTTKGPWHTYTLEWSASSIKVLYDGKVCLENTSWGANMPAPFNTPVMIALTIGLDPVHKENPATPLPSSWSADIDYVKVWQ